MRKLLFIAAVTLVAAGCGRRGTVDDGLYRNDFFGFTMAVPEGMYVMPRGEMDSISAAEENSELLLFISAQEPSQTDSLFNYNITITSEKLSAVKSNEQYISLVVNALHGVAEDIPVGRASLGSRGFMKVSIPWETFSQDIYTLVHDGYALIIVGSYDGPEQQEAVGRIIATAAFDKG